MGWVVTLYITPVVYTYLDGLQSRLASRRVRRAARLAPVPGVQPGDD